MSDIDADDDAATRARGAEDFREYCRKCAEIVATWPEWKQNALGTIGPVFRDGPRQWYWVEVFAALGGPPLAGVWVRAGTRADAWHEVIRELSAAHAYTLWDATTDADLSASERARAGRPPATGNRSEVFDAADPCVIVVCRGDGPPAGS